jgi:hypothetical protein
MLVARIAIPKLKLFILILNVNVSISKSYANKCELQGTSHPRALLSHLNQNNTAQSAIILNKLNQKCTNPNLAVPHTDPDCKARIFTACTQDYQYAIETDFEQLDYQALANCIDNDEGLSPAAEQDEDYKNLGCQMAKVNALVQCRALLNEGDNVKCTRNRFGGYEIEITEENLPLNIGRENREFWDLLQIPATPGSAECSPTNETLQLGTLANAYCIMRSSNPMYANSLNDPMDIRLTEIGMIKDLYARQFYQYISHYLNYYLTGDQRFFQGVDLREDLLISTEGQTNQFDAEKVFNHFCGKGGMYRCEKKFGDIGVIRKSIRETVEKLNKQNQERNVKVGSLSYDNIITETESALKSAYNLCAGVKRRHQEILTLNLAGGDITPQSLDQLSVAWNQTLDNAARNYGTDGWGGMDRIESYRRVLKSDKIQTSYGGKKDNYYYQSERIRQQTDAFYISCDDLKGEDENQTNLFARYLLIPEADLTYINPVDSQPITCFKIGNVGLSYSQQLACRFAIANRDKFIYHKSGDNECPNGISATPNADQYKKTITDYSEDVALLDAGENQFYTATEENQSFGRELANINKYTMFMPANKVNFLPMDISAPIQTQCPDILNEYESEDEFLGKIKKRRFKRRYRKYTKRYRNKTKAKAFQAFMDLTVNTRTVPNWSDKMREKKIKDFYDNKLAIPYFTNFEDDLYNTSEQEKVHTKTTPISYGIKIERWEDAYGPSTSLIHNDPYKQCRHQGYIACKMGAKPNKLLNEALNQSTDTLLMGLSMMDTIPPVEIASDIIIMIRDIRNANALYHMAQKEYYNAIATEGYDPEDADVMEMQSLYGTMSKDYIDVKRSSIIQLVAIGCFESAKMIRVANIARRMRNNARKVIRLANKIFRRSPTNNLEKLESIKLLASKPPAALNDADLDELDDVYRHLDPDTRRELHALRAQDRGPQMREKLRCLIGSYRLMLR